MHEQPLKLLESARLAGLISQAEEETLRRELTGNSTSERETASKLIEKNILTRYQADQLISGDWKSCVLADRYQLLEHLGAGAMGTVYRALDTKLDRKVAVKVLPPRSLGDADAMARFEREAKALAQLSHPNIIQAFDADRDGNRHFLVMEYGQGTSFLEMIRTQGRIAPPLAADYIYQAALGLQHAHDKGLVHRDLKPGNLLLTSDGQTKILDLGLARFLQDQIGDPDLTREGTGIGTPDYMAPEQFHDARSADPRSDVYALGCTLYHMLTGVVLFPGSSLNEKAEAHARSESPAIIERCPDAPVGLTLVVRKMLAKKPSDRFQTARELAEALAPYVSGSSTMVPQLEPTANWTGSQLAFTVPKRRSRTLLWSASGVTATMLLTIAFFWLPAVISGLSTSNGPDPESDKGEAKPAITTISNGLTVAQDGTGQYQTIGEALKNVQPGMTIDVLDDAVYPEQLLIDDAERFRNVTLLASNQATLELPPQGTQTIRINGVPGFRLVNFRIRHSRAAGIQSLVTVSGNVFGSVLRNLDLQLSASANGIALGAVRIPPDASAFRIEECVILGGARGIELGDSTGVRIQGNRIGRSVEGIQIRGTVQRTHIVSNIISDCQYASLDVDNLAPDSAANLVANNTFHNCGFLVRIWDDEPYEQREQDQIRFANNLLFSAGMADIALIHAPENADPQPVDGSELAKLWTFHCNWRQPTGTFANGALPHSANDHEIDEISVVSRSESDAGFLQPKPDSELANQGAGKDDPSFPSYVGAVAPADSPEWNWDWTWDGQVHNLLTVSKDQANGGRFRRISAALEKVRPGMTIRVVDNATYSEAVRINVPNRHSGITLETREKATIHLTPTSQRALAINNVPGVMVRGFRFRESPETHAGHFVTVESVGAGIVLEDLDLQANAGNKIGGISLSNLSHTPNEAPLEVSRCVITGGYNGIETTGSKDTCGGIMVRDSRISGVRGSGVFLGFSIGRIHITGNVLYNCGLSGIEIQDLKSGIEEILIANNTAFASDMIVRVVDAPPFEEIVSGQVHFYNNLFFDSQKGDVVSLVPGASGVVTPSVERSLLVVERWDFRHNYRDLSGTFELVPLSPDDRKPEGVALISRDPTDSDFLRPTKDSPLAKGGVGTVDPSLPGYVGAIAPSGAEQWDWYETWELRTSRNQAEVN